MAKPTFSLHHLHPPHCHLYLLLLLLILLPFHDFSQPPNTQKMQAPTFIFLLLGLLVSASGFGSMGPISASFGGDVTESGFFCAIDASGKQEVICWAKNSTLTRSPLSSSSSADATESDSGIPALAALSGGEGFLCGILANTSQAFCWSPTNAGSDLVPLAYQSTSYSHIAAGKDHVCAVRGSYFSDHDSGSVDCWDVKKTSVNGSSLFASVQSSVFYDQSISNLAFNKVVAGEGFSCGRVREGGVVCWGPESDSLGVSKMSDSESYDVLASGKDTVCGILEGSKEVKCWGKNNGSLSGPLVGAQFVSLAAGANHFCGIRADNHAVQCWGSFNASSLPKGDTGFVAIASSDFTTCGIRENDLVLDCWIANGTMPLEYDPPLELCSPGLCRAGLCGEGRFVFNASILNEPDLTDLCVRKDLKICSPCGSNCSEGFFLSSPCTENSDRVCTSCSLCQNSTCSTVCGLQSHGGKQFHRLRRLLIISTGTAILGFVLVVLSWCIYPWLLTCRREEGSLKKFKSCMGKPESETDAALNLYPPPAEAPCPGQAQVFRLSELKDATNGFKEFNELGRGSYGFVYKAVLADGTQVAVKRANAATIIHTNGKEFEVEIEILCKVRHSNIVNLLGYCSEMGEWLLVYEYMPHGALHDHLHGGRSPLNWSVRLKIAMQAAKGLEYLHKEVQPPLVHQNVKTSNILLDAEWGARIADFGLLTLHEKCAGDVKADVYNFGIVLLEILTGRKAYDREYSPPDIVQWAVPLIKQGRAAVTIDRYVALPRNFEPLLKLADIAELAVREDPNQRPSMSYISTWLEQIVVDGIIL